MGLGEKYDSWRKYIYIPDLGQGHADVRHHGGEPAGLHLPRARLLPEAQAHGAGQDARTVHRTPGRPHQAAHRGPIQVGPVSYFSISLFLNKIWRPDEQYFMKGLGW